MRTQKIRIRDARIWCYQTGPFTFGFTTRGITRHDLVTFTGARISRELTQTHSNRILLSSRTTSGRKGDGIILDQRDVLVIIKTADCLPLFFWDTAEKTGGILHIGWRGAAKDIEIKLLEKLKSQGIPPATLLFLMGPCICSRCFEVGDEIPGQFTNRDPVPEFFHRHPGPGKYRLDLKKKVRLTLQKNGVPGRSIRSSGICTYSDARFHSHRRSPTSKGRIFNFMIRQ
jgi:YfiH family protein